MKIRRMVECVGYAEKETTHFYCWKTDRPKKAVENHRTVADGDLLMERCQI